MTDSSQVPGLRASSAIAPRISAVHFQSSQQPIYQFPAALRVALADPKLKKLYADGGMDEYPTEKETPEAAAALLKSEIKRWGDVVRTNHIFAK